MQPTITFIGSDGIVTKVAADPGETAMEAARRSDVSGILAECGGCCSCATCHVHVDPAWMDRVGPPGDEEQFTLDGAFDVQPNSRLSCQIEVTEALDGLLLTVPGDPA